MSGGLVCSDVDAVLKQRAVREERVQLGKAHAVEDLYLGARAGAWGGDDVCAVVAVDVRGSDANASGEGGAVRQETVQERAVGAVEDVHGLIAAWARPDDHVGGLVAVDVPGGH